MDKCIARACGRQGGSPLRTSDPCVKTGATSGAHRRLELYDSRAAQDSPAARRRQGRARRRRRRPPPRSPPNGCAGGVAGRVARTNPVRRVDAFVRALRLSLDLVSSVPGGPRVGARGPGAQRAVEHGIFRRVGRSEHLRRPRAHSSRRRTEGLALLRREGTAFLRLANLSAALSCAAPRRARRASRRRVGARRTAASAPGGPCVCTTRARTPRQARAAPRAAARAPRRPWRVEDDDGEEVRAGHGNVFTPSLVGDEGREERRGRRDPRRVVDPSALTRYFFHAAAGRPSRVRVGVGVFAAGSRVAPASLGDEGRPGSARGRVAGRSGWRGRRVRSRRGGARRAGGRARRRARVVRGASPGRGSRGGRASPRRGGRGARGGRGGALEDGREDSEVAREGARVGGARQRRARGAETVVGEGGARGDARPPNVAGVSSLSIAEEARASAANVRGDAMCAATRARDTADAPRPRRGE